MMNKKFSSVGDLTALCLKMEKVISDEFNLKERPAFIVSFTLPQDFSEAHWVCNIGRPDAAKILKLTREKLLEKSN